MFISLCVCVCINIYIYHNLMNSRSSAAMSDSEDVDEFVESIDDATSTQTQNNTSRAVPSPPRRISKASKHKTDRFWERIPGNDVKQEVPKYVDLYLFIVSFEHYKDDLSKILEHFEVELSHLDEFKTSPSNPKELVKVYRKCKQRVLPRVMIKTGEGLAEKEDPWSIRSNYELWSGYPLYDLAPLDSLDSIHIKNGYKLYPYNDKKVEYQIPEVIYERFYTFIKSCIDIAKQQEFKKGTVTEITCKNDKVRKGGKQKITKDTYKLVSNGHILQYNFPRLKFNISGYFFEGLKDVKDLPLGTIRYSQMTAKYYLFKELKYAQSEKFMEALQTGYGGEKHDDDFSLEMEQKIRNITSTIDSKVEDVEIVYSRARTKLQDHEQDSCYLDIKLNTPPVHRRAIIDKIRKLLAR